MITDREQIREKLLELGLRDRDVAVHCSLRSFGPISDGPEGVIHALLDVCGTVLMPAFSEIGRTNPPDNDQPAQNGWDYGEYTTEVERLVRFDPSAFNVMSGLNSDEMGIVGAQFLRKEGTIRSKHPSVSWAANGPLAESYVSDHHSEDPNLPLKRLKEREGAILLLGVDLSSCTAVHLAEELAGRRPFVRWTLYADGIVRRMREYGCSDAFPRLVPFVEKLASRVHIGSCKAVSYPIAPFVDILAEVMLATPEITICGKERCRCIDSSKGGPLA